MEIVDEAVSILSNFGYIGGFILVYMESIIPVLPLSVFITLNMITFGKVIGFIISWIGTIIGCFTSFFLSRKLKNKVEQNYKDNNKINAVKKYIDKLSFTTLVVLIAIPFTPAFAVNIAAGLSNIDSKKFVIALLIGKLSLVYFWGFVGTSLYESITDVKVIIKIIVLVVGAYIVGKIVNKVIESKF